MIDSQPANYQKQAAQLWSRMIKPHSSVESMAEFRRAQLLSIFTLILSALFVSAILSRPRSIGVFLVLGGITITSFILTKTKYYRAGTYLFTYAFTAIGYIRIYQGTASSIESSITSTVHIALIFSSVILSQRGFAGLVVLSALATFTAPFYSAVSVTEPENITRSGGVLIVIGAILYGIQVFRENQDRENLKSLTEINQELEDSKANLEQHIEVRTIELEKANKQIQDRATRLQTIAEISQEISSSIDRGSKELLDQITQLISNKLNFYHVGIFLLDENRDFAVLRAANSEGGQRMLDRRHQLKVGGTGIVGYASQSGRARIALDTGKDAVFFNNPDLPKTRSEIALPLKYGATTIGVLDVQSTLRSAFEDEDINILSALANQVAIIINTVLVNEKNKLGISSQKMSGQLKSQSVQNSYTYLPDGTISNSALETTPAAAPSETIIINQPSKNIPPTLRVPVKFREQIIGVIQIEAAEENRKWTEDEVLMVQSISDRAGFALENARLFEETVRRADQEETIARVTTQIGSSTDFNRILQTTVQELGRALGASRSFIQMGTPAEDK